ncbi:glycosyltransferase [Gramella sp. AN32]|uniref:Glycosyltransferase n=1 Tax=Christiangramia antarctica TaxID=2058158 RepID=A0ABW5X987_9FLAO|nr:glycosyltransferase [Gramella sp. AN32]MCM4154700.1 glycosyl transferase family 2 [Gramella sp. AN32]
MSSKVSIIIPCYNDHEFIEKSVNSAIVQSYPNKEVIVVDDGSNNKTKAVLKKLESKIDHLITQDNLGVSSARNRGIKSSSGKYILNLDSDDYFESEFCERAVTEFQKDQDIEIVTCFANWFRNEKEYKLFKPRGGGLKNILVNNVAMGSSMFLKERWQDVGGYDETMVDGYEDWEFYIRLLKDGGKAMVIPEILFNYRNKVKSRNDNANSLKYELRQYIYLKHSELYKDHFKSFVIHMMNMMRKEELDKQKSLESLEHKLGERILWPFRKIKNLK